MKLKPLLQLVLISCNLITAVNSTYAQGTAFTYQGRLNDGGILVNGIYDLKFGIYDAASAGNQQGGARTNFNTTVNNGLFTVTLDFGNQFPGTSRWLEIGVRTNGATNFQALEPRQLLTPTPYAAYAGNATSAASIMATNIVGAIQLAQLPGTVVTNGASGVNFIGTFSGDGGGLTNLASSGTNSHNFVGDGSGLTNVQIASASTTNLALLNNANYGTNVIYVSGSGDTRENGVYTNAGAFVSIGRTFQSWTNHGSGFIITLMGNIYSFQTNASFDPGLVHRTYLFTNLPGWAVRSTFFLGIYAGPAPGPFVRFSSTPGMVMDGVVIGNGVGLTNIPSSSLQSPLDVGTVNATNFRLSGAIINGASSLALTTMRIGGVDANVLSTSAPLAGDAGLTTNLPTPGWIWNQMPVPALFLSTYPSDVCNSSESLVISNIFYARTNGMWAAGWTTILLEDGQYQPFLDNNENLVAGTNFPSGFASLTALAHANGFKIGSYLSAGRSCCAWADPGTRFDLIGQHIKQNLDWGFDGLTIDECGIVGSTNFSLNRRYVMNTFNQVAFNDGWEPWSATPRRGMFLILAQNNGLQPYLPWESPWEVNLMGINIMPFERQTQSNMLQIAYECIANSQYIGPGHYLDPTSWMPNLNSFAKLSDIKQMLSFYFMTASPIQIGIRSYDPGLPYLTNTEAIAVLKDKAVIPCWVAYTNNLAEIWVRPLGGTVWNNPIVPVVPNPQSLTLSNAVLLINAATTNQTITCYATNLGQDPTAAITLRDPWTHTTISNFVGNFSWTIGPAESQLLTTFATPNVNASSLSGGTVSASLLPATVITNNGALIAGRLVLGDGGRGLTTASASGTVPVNADGSATSFSQLNALFPSAVLTNNGSAPITFRNSVTIEGAYQFNGNGAGLTNLNIPALTGGITTNYVVPGGATFYITNGVIGAIR